MSDQLVFLAALPFAWTFWLWVGGSCIEFCFSAFCGPFETRRLTRFPSLDDSFQTDDCLPHLSNILQLPRNVLFRERGRVPGKIPYRTLSVASLFLVCDRT
jgi:hypothetical protein